MITWSILLTVATTVVSGCSSATTSHTSKPAEMPSTPEAEAERIAGHWAAAVEAGDATAAYLCTKTGPAGEKVKDAAAFAFEGDELRDSTIIDVTPGVQREGRYVDIEWTRNGQTERWRVSALIDDEGIYNGDTCLYAISGPVS